jgi:hypothetical protein
MVTVERVSPLLQAGAVLTPPKSDCPGGSDGWIVAAPCQALFTGGATCLAASSSVIGGRRQGSSLGDAPIDDGCG